MVIGYPQPGKPKSLRVCAAFVEGAQGRLTTDYRLHDDTEAVFYGTVGIESLFNDATARNAWYYLDNSFFDGMRNVCFRVGKNALQTMSVRPNLIRAREMGLKITPWQTTGRNVLVVEQSDYYMRTIAGWSGGTAAWRVHVLHMLHHMTDRPIVARAWARDKIGAMRDFAKELSDAWIVVTHSSAAACEALLRGVPVLVTDRSCVAVSMSGTWAPRSVEEPYRPEDRVAFVARLAASQWTLGEMRSGVAWKAVREWT